MKQRNIGIDILKCIAAILIINSHAELLYVDGYQQLATGGAIGDALFFFCSGFTLFLGSAGRFDNWYKRRINRIYPTVFAWAILTAAIFGRGGNIVEVILDGGGWFVSCIMVYYVILYFIRKYFIDKLLYVFGLVAVLCVALYCLLVSLDVFMLDHSSALLEPHKWIYQSYFKRSFFFLAMLLGAMLGVSKREWKYRLSWDFLKLMICIVLWYGILIMAQKIEIVQTLQIVSVVPLLGATFYFYKVCNSDLLAKIYKRKIPGAIIKVVGGLCLEIYLVQYVLFTNKMNGIFPLNLLIMFLIIVVAAYVLRCFARIFSQTFKDADYDWKSVFKLY
jgi:peptidoglycan/LPS O-acetylase OafA/YrhL